MKENDINQRLEIKIKYKDHRKIFYYIYYIHIY